MVMMEPEVNSQEVESALQLDQQDHGTIHRVPSLGRQSSIYSLTLDEFQNTLLESGKNFGSMNMDELLSNIWSAEENQANAVTETAANMNANLANNPMNVNNSDVGKPKQQGLARQGSLSLPEPLSKKTVDEVWTEIRKRQQMQSKDNGGPTETSESAARQPTFGEMTLEAFLVKAGVVSEQCEPQPVQSQQQHYGIYQGNNSNSTSGTGYGTRPSSEMIAPCGGVGGNYLPEYQGGGPAAPRAGMYGGRLGNGGEYGRAGQGTGMAYVSPSDETLANIDNSGSPYGMDLCGPRRKRIIDGPVEKVVERRQRRMIKNRESAARSRARKQAYTVELEAELNQLKEENTHLQHALEELERKRMQQYVEDPRMSFQTKAHESLKFMRRNMSSPI